MIASGVESADVEIPVVASTDQQVRPAQDVAALFESVQEPIIFAGIR